MLAADWLVILCYCIVAYGACNVMVFGSGPFRIFEHLRSITMRINEHFGSMFSCMMCLPANFGWICSLVNFLFFPIPFTPFNIIFGGMPPLFLNVVMMCLCDGAFTSGAVWLIHHVEEFFENIGEGNINSPRNDDNDKDDNIIQSEDITL